MQRKLCYFTFAVFLASIVFYFTYFYLFTIPKSNFGNLHLENENVNFSNIIARDSNSQSFPSSDVDVLIVFTKADQQNEIAKEKFRRTTKSLLKKSSASNIILHVVADNASRFIADSIFRNSDFESSNFAVRFYDINSLSKQISRQLGADLLQYFRFSPDSYYGDALFFLSLVTADLFPGLKRVLKIDSDLLFRGDVAELWTHFEKFSSANRFGFAREQQPVYRHVFGAFRSLINSSTKIGDPPPDGVTGFNSGVILMDLEKIRTLSSPSFRSLIRLGNVRRLVDKYKFRGHLGDQDLYTLLSIENPELFYVLPCQWNRQLCQWWREHGYVDVFDSYFNCPGSIKIYHGNCQTPLPSLDPEET